MAKKTKNPVPCDNYDEVQRKKRCAQQEKLAATEPQTLGEAVKTYLTTQKFLHERGVYPSSY